jgi:hypothetical protein
MPFGGIGKTLQNALGGKNIGKLMSETLDKKVMGDIGKTIQNAMGQGGPMEAAMKKALDGIKKVEAQGKELAKVAGDAEKKGEEAVGDAMGGMKKLIDGQAAAIGNLQKALQEALDNLGAEGDEEAGGGKGGKGKKGKGGGADEIGKKLEEALKKVSGIAKTAGASKKEVAKAKKNKGKKRGRAA